MDSSAEYHFVVAHDGEQWNIVDMDINSNGNVWVKDEDHPFNGYWRSYEDGELDHEVGLLDDLRNRLGM